MHFQISDDEVSVFKSIFPYQYYLPKKYVVLIRNSLKFVSSKFRMWPRCVPNLKIIDQFVPFLI